MWERFAQTFRAAMADVRREVVERGWFGRAEMPNPTSFGERSQDEAMFPDPSTLRDLHDWMAPAEHGGADHDPSPQPSPDIGIDR